MLVVCALALAQVAAEAPAFDVQGHRGARGIAPENTLTGFRAALAIGVSTLEADLAVTRDGVVVVSHDPLLNPDIVRDPSGAWLPRAGPPIHALTLAELRRYDVGRIDPRSDYARALPAQRPADGEAIPTLEELLELARDTSVRLNLELKFAEDPKSTPDPATFVRLVVAAIDAARMRARVTIQAFDWHVLELTKDRAPDIQTSCLTTEKRNAPPTAAYHARCGVWSPHWRVVSAARVAEAHALGLKVIPWTVNEPAEMQRLIGLGVDGVITDYPDRLRAVMQALGMSLRESGAR